MPRMLSRQHALDTRRRMFLVSKNSRLNLVFMFHFLDPSIVRPTSFVKLENGCSSNNTRHHALSRDCSVLLINLSARLSEDQTSTSPVSKTDLVCLHQRLISFLISWHSRFKLRKFQLLSGPPRSSMMPLIPFSWSEKSSWPTTWMPMTYYSRWSWTHGMSRLNSPSSLRALGELIHHSVRVRLVHSSIRFKIKSKWLKFKRCSPTSAELFLTPLITRTKCSSHFTKKFISITRKTFSWQF